MTIFILNNDSLEIVDRRNKSHHIQNCTKIALIIEFNCISTMGTKLGTSIECLAAPPSQRFTTPVYAGLFRALVLLWPFSPWDMASQLKVRHSTKRPPDVCPVFRHIFHSIVRSPSIWFTLSRYYIIATLYLYSRLDNTSAHFAHSQFH